MDSNHILSNRNKFYYFNNANSVTLLFFTV